VSGVPQVSTLCPLLFNIFINGTCNSAHNSRYLLFADDLKIHRLVISVDDCKLYSTILIQCEIGVRLTV
jgi:hypothetical protein